MKTKPFLVALVVACLLGGYVLGEIFFAQFNSPEHQLLRLIERAKTPEQAAILQAVYGAHKLDHDRALAAWIEMYAKVEVEHPGLGEREFFDELMQEAFGARLPEKK